MINKTRKTWKLVKSILFIRSTNIRISKIEEFKINNDKSYLKGI